MDAEITNASSPNTKDIDQSGGDSAGDSGMANASFSYTYKAKWGDWLVHVRRTLKLKFLFFFIYFCLV